MTLTSAPLSLFKFNMYAAMGKENPWASYMASPDSTDEEQDTIKVRDILSERKLIKYSLYRSKIVKIWRNCIYIFYGSIVLVYPMFAVIFVVIMSFVM